MPWTNSFRHCRFYQKVELFWITEKWLRKSQATILDVVRFCNHIHFGRKMKDSESCFSLTILSLYKYLVLHFFRDINRCFFSDDFVCFCERKKSILKNAEVLRSLIYLNSIYHSTLSYNTLCCTVFQLLLFLFSGLCRAWQSFGQRFSD